MNGGTLNVALFLLTFFLIYGSFHIYFYLKVRAAFAPGGAAQAILIVLLLLGLIAPILIRMCERYGLEMAARFLSWAGYLWMGFLLLFFSISILFDLWRFLTYLAGWALRFDSARCFLRRGCSFSFPLLLRWGSSSMAQ